MAGIATHAFRKILANFEAQGRGVVAQLWDEGGRAPQAAAVELSAVEVCGNCLADLLDPSAPGAPGEDGASADAKLLSGAFCRASLASEAKLASVLQSALERRRPGGRGHVVVALHVLWLDASGAERRGQLNIVDLAGESRTENDARRPQVPGTAMGHAADAAAVTASLGALGNVITALHAGAATPPFGASLLTTLLAPHMRQGSGAVMMICIAPHPKYFSDTLETLTFALKARGAAASRPPPAAVARAHPQGAHGQPIGAPLRRTDAPLHSFASMVTASSVLSMDHTGKPGPAVAAAAMQRRQSTAHFAAPWSCAPPPPRRAAPVGVHPAGLPGPDYAGAAGALFSAPGHLAGASGRSCPPVGGAPMRVDAAEGRGKRRAGACAEGVGKASKKKTKLMEAPPPKVSAMPQHDNAGNATRAAIEVHGQPGGLDGSVGHLASFPGNFATGLWGVVTTPGRDNNGSGAMAPSELWGAPPLTPISQLLQGDGGASGLDILCPGTGDRLMGTATPKDSHLNPWSEKRLSSTKAWRRTPLASADAAHNSTTTPGMLLRGGGLDEPGGKDVAGLGGRNAADETPVTIMRTGMGGIFPPSAGTPQRCGGMLSDPMPLGSELSMMTPLRGLEHDDVLRLSMPPGSCPKFGDDFFSLGETPGIHAECSPGNQMMQHFASAMPEQHSHEQYQQHQQHQHQPYDTQHFGAGRADGDVTAWERHLLGLLNTGNLAGITKVRETLPDSRPLAASGKLLGIRC